MGDFNDLKNRVAYGVPLAAVALTCLAFGLSAGLFITIIAGIFVWEVVSTLLRNWPSPSEKAIVPLVFLCFGFGGFYAALILRAENNGFFILILVALGVVATDTFAYIGGKKYGHTKFFPSISPNKTREGVMIGLGCGTIALFVGWSVLYRLELTGLEPFGALVMAVLLPVFAVAGDLLESWSKRRLGVKDFGTLLGSHGGVADRFDSMTVAFMAYALISPYFM